MMGSVEASDHSEETYAVVVDDLRDDGGLSGVFTYGSNKDGPLTSSKLSIASLTIN